MIRNRGRKTLLALSLLVATAGTASAERVAMTRTAGAKSGGAREDITVPYLTTGKTAFGAYSVAPIITSSPIVDDPSQPQARPVFNLIFWGAEQAFGDRSNGAAPRKR